jgi:hypothetical protein
MNKKHTFIWDLREIRSQAEVAQMMGMTRAALNRSEQRALRKLCRGLARVKFSTNATV